MFGICCMRAECSMPGVADHRDGNILCGLSLSSKRRSHELNINLACRPNPPSSPKMEALRLDEQCFIHKTGPGRCQWWYVIDSQRALLRAVFSWGPETAGGPAPAYRVLYSSRLQKKSTYSNKLSCTLRAVCFQKLEKKNTVLLLTQTSVDGKPNTQRAVVTSLKCLLLSEVFMINVPNQDASVLKKAIGGLSGKV